MAAPKLLKCIESPKKEREWPMMMRHFLGEDESKSASVQNL